MKNAGYYLKIIKKNRILFITAACTISIVMAAVLFLALGNNRTITVEQAESLTAEDKSVKEKGSEETVYVDVSGCVKKPGVYEVSAACRIFEVIEKAGGVTKDADTSSINQAEPVTDGQKINVPGKNSPREEDSYSDKAQAAGEKDPGKININTATSSLLQEIPGVGPVTAEKIISYREQNGYFRSIGDIKNVSGIGDKTYEKMKDLITC